MNYYIVLYYILYITNMLLYYVIIYYYMVLHYIIYYYMLQYVGPALTVFISGTIIYYLYHLNQIDCKCSLTFQKRLKDILFLCSRQLVAQLTNLLTF